MWTKQTVELRFRLAQTQMCVALTVEPEFDHAPVHFDRGLASLGVLATLTWL